MQGRAFLGPKAEAAREIVFGARDRCDETVLRFRTARDERYRYIRNFTPGKPFLLPNAYKQRQYPVWRLLQDPDVQQKLTTPSQRLLVAPSMPDEELYETRTDPHETVNLVSSKKAEDRAALERLRGALDKWIRDANDHGVKLEH
jgi:hypothetical protein